MEYEVVVGFAGYIGVEETYTVDADTEDEARVFALDEAKDDLTVEDVVDLDDGEYEVTVGFGGYIGAEETYTVAADNEGEAEELGLDEAAFDLSVNDISLVE